MIEFEGLHHAAVGVTDVARAKQFYGEVLGLREAARPAFPFGGAWYELSDGRQLHLIAHEQSLTLRGTTAIDLGDGHVAFRVGDYDRTLAYLRTRGVECLERPDNITPWKQIYVTDPDGNVLEFNCER